MDSHIFGAFFLVLCSPATQFAGSSSPLRVYLDSPANSYTGTKVPRAIIHSVLNGLAFLLFTGAFVVIVVNKFGHNGIHFESPHAILGLITYIGIIIQVLIGLAQFYTPSVFGSIERAKSIYKYHRIAGYVLQIVLLGTILAATQTTFNLNALKIKTWQVSVGVVLVLLGVLPRIRKEKLGFRANSN